MYCERVAETTGAWRRKYGEKQSSVYASGACEVRTCLHGQREGGKCRGICGQVSV